MKGGMEKKQVLEKYMGYLQAGSAFPDWGYACGDRDAAEEAHWPPFVQEFISYIHDLNLDESSDRYHRLVAFLMGVVSH